MDGTGFDTLARTLSTAGSRRRALAGLVAGALGLLASRAEETEAKKGKRKKKKKKGPGLSCPSGYTNCGGQCVDLTDHTQHCGGCSVVCSPGKVCCNGVCANLQDDDNHCAACGSKCLPDPFVARPQGAICVSGTCEQCALQGTRHDTSPPRCCRGLKRCQSPTTGRDDCIPVGDPC